MVIHNLRKAQKKWAHMLIVLGRKGGDYRTMGMFCVVVAKVFILYGSKMWVMSLYIGRNLGRFRHRVVRRLTGWQPRMRKYGMWV